MLTQRQNAILEYLQKNGEAPQSSILAEIATKFDAISKPTILRDLEALLIANLIIKKGKARAVVYLPKISNPLLYYYSPDVYFKKSQDQRDIKEKFNWEIFNWFENVFTSSELTRLEKINNEYQTKRTRLSPIALKKELERLTIEISWKSSRLEGNTYSLFETETLIKEAREASGHNKKEAIMILNHKVAFDYILSDPTKFKLLKPIKIRDVHSLLIKDLDVPDNWRSILVRIIGTNYQPIDNRFQIEDAVAKIVEVINKTKSPPEKALFALALIAYTQPFVDGNKRTSRIVANALLLANDWCPMSLRSLDETEYKKAMLLFYEQNSLAYLKELFIQQFEFAVKNYF
ncbi:MAG: hypothetical protein A3J93_04265 [Candidatus Magasanikbacteria bacterium RIFOXYC2_FULL_42_28]|uniref:Fido domain-containing protein n=1 Tax=Candidatus Magasanikbacteria bacterium RIFOXYC2_FULL_42_28 TaxID=1798704 RepID=A0A1F6NX02_9BACT|nr:MAG: hypothetical protein A3J93_04265 [Candidatus Magasanikbacteria bacterium RIFOXYC2_FULL_42_28]